jgi:endonuclease/exonuclease/phosphatase family metal-dependent hydrolase
MVVLRLYTRVALTLVSLAAVSIAVSSRGPLAAASNPGDGADIVISASSVSTLNGHWSRQASTDAGNSVRLTSPDGGWATTGQPLADPTHYFETTFEAESNTPYRVWLRLRATGNSKWNDSVWVQFDGARHNDGTPAYPIGTTRGLLVNLAQCSTCATAEWGWLNGAYWLQQRSVVSFAAPGPHTIRVQTREDGVEIDQIVLSPVRFLSSAPGPMLNDNTIVSLSGAGAIEGAAQVETQGAVIPAFGGISAAGTDDTGGGVAIALPNPSPQSPPPAPAPPPPPPPPPPPSAPGTSFRMMTWNIQHGRTKAKAYDPAAQARFIADQNPQVVALQEVQTWDENQPARYKALLEQYTGVAWHLQWAPVNGNAGTEGNVILTRLPVVSSTYFQMHATGDHDALYSNRSTAQATVTVGGVKVHVFSTHLDWYNTAHRTAQLHDMMAWTETFGARRIVGGDFNSWWGESWIITMMGDYYDTWLDVTGSKQNGHTVNNAVRFDYLFRAKDGATQITPTRITAPATALSDHNPVIADYLVKP